MLRYRFPFVVGPWIFSVVCASACGSTTTTGETNNPPLAIEAAAPTAEAESPEPPAADAAMTEAAPAPPPTGDDGSTSGDDVGTTTPPLEAGVSGGDDGGAGEAGPGDAATASGPYSCTLYVGILATDQFWGDFEKLINPAHWELIWVHSGFVQLWANPKDPVWSTKITTPCAENAQTPDRIIFVALNFDYNTLAEWLPPLTAAAKNLQAKYPSAKRIELGTFVRAPGNMACPQAPAPRSTISPAEDQAIAMVAQTNPSLFAVAPKFEAKACSDFISNPPHPTTAGAENWAQEIAQYYGLGQ